MAFRYTGPLEGKLRLDRAYGLVVRVDGDDGSVGLGEATVGYRDVDAAWSALEKLAAQLIGSALPRQFRPEHPLSSISAWTPAKRGSTVGVKAAQLAVETALIDLAMKVTGYQLPIHSVAHTPLLRLPRKHVAPFLREVADQQRTGDLAADVVVEFGLDGRTPAEVTSAQAIAADLAGSDGTQIAVVLRGGRKVGKALEDLPSISGVSLSTSRWGSWLDVRRAATRIKRANPAINVVLANDGRGSDITAAALSTLAATTPAVDVVAQRSPSGTWPDRLTTGSGPAGELDLVALGLVADRVIENPAPPRAEIYPGANDYPEEITPLTPYGIPKQTIMELEALKAGLATRRYGRQLFLADHERLEVPIGFSGPQSSSTSVAAGSIAGHKGMTRAVLMASGLPVAPGGWFPAGATQKVIAAATELGFPLVAKPADGLKGYAVTTGIRTMAELEAALERIESSSFGDAGIILESMVSGNDYRVFATTDEVVSVARRDPAYVIGDGLHTIAELILLANIARRRNPYVSRHLMRPDERYAAIVKEQGFTFDSVPGADVIVQLGKVANLSQGGVSTEVLDTSHPSLHDLATRIVSSIPGLPYAGIDIFMEDHTQPVDTQDVTIIEVNHNPALMLHPYPVFGPSQNVSRHLLGAFAARQGVVLDEPRERLTVRLNVYGNVQRVGYRRWMFEAASTLGLDGWVRNADDPNRVDAVVSGQAEKVAVLIRLAFGGPPKANVVETYVELGDETPDPGFAVRADNEERACV